MSEEASDSLAAITSSGQRALMITGRDHWLAQCEDYAVLLSDFYNGTRCRVLRIVADEQETLAHICIAMGILSASLPGQSPQSLPSSGEDGIEQTPSTTITLK